MVDGLLILLLFQFLGELVIHFTGLPLPAVTRSTDANVLRMSTNRFHLAAFTTANQRSKAGRSGGCRRIHPLTVRGFTTRTLPKCQRRKISFWLAA